MGQRFSINPENDVIIELDVCTQSSGHYAKFFLFKVAAPNRNRYILVTEFS